MFIHKRLAGYGWIRNPKAPTWSDVIAAERQQLDMSLSKGPPEPNPTHDFIDCNCSGRKFNVLQIFDSSV